MRAHMSMDGVGYVLAFAHCPFVGAGASGQ